MNNKLTVVVGDAHVDPSQLTKHGMRRFEWLRNMLADYQPENLVLIGDFGTMPSMSEWDKDKRLLMEGKRLQDDWDSMNSALDIMGGYNIPNKIYIEGNHEEWVSRYVEKHPEVAKMKDFDIKQALMLKERGYKFIPYREDWKYRGVSFTHVPIQANGKPVGGKNATQRALDVYSNSVVFGHTHNFDVAAVHRKNSPSLQQAINCGCFFEHVDEYAKGSMTNYWRGILILDHYDHNRVDIEQWSLGRMKRIYG